MMNLMRCSLLAAGLVALPASLTFAAAPAPEGFTDTPKQPDGKWHVHDPTREVQSHSSRAL